ncbi:MAG: 50S ribosomal protein L23 [Deltaproteobacteria bacterium]|jgi:large subunit ribosomal protein L23|nr:50S ribosomal protein L23 [Deltaproteobacteria bacterium]MBW2504505.1 50S ribosomal protein L23 [Deltaproteobacteria bacterium]MBW2520616.1 50S ribosomal protein L23 [Deltaproteobacteria bacterium]
MKPLHQIIRKPLITEKSNLQKEIGNTVAFEVALTANKVEIRRAVEKAFNVKVKDVRTMVVAGKQKRFGRNFGKRSNVKKAYITLAEGNIDFFGV